MDVSEIIAYNLKRIRGERNLSLGQLADAAGVSKVVLSKIEKGEGNPTINTIWKITGALQLPYTSLLEMPENETAYIRKQDINPLVEDKYHIYSYFPELPDRNMELYQIEMEQGCVHPSQGHSSKSYEYIMVIEGEIELLSADKVHFLRKDDALCFDGSIPHTYRTVGEKDARLVLIIYYV